MIKKAYVFKIWRIGVFTWKGTEHRWVDKAGIRAMTAEEALVIAKGIGIVAPVVDGVDHAS